jgi:hypothetical protein
LRFLAVFRLEKQKSIILEGRVLLCRLNSMSISPSTTLPRVRNSLQYDHPFTFVSSNKQNKVPVTVYVEVKSLSGRVMLYGPPGKVLTREGVFLIQNLLLEIWERFSLSFLELPQCDFDVRLKVGKDNKYDLSKISKVSDFIVSNLKRILWKNIVTPVTASTLCTLF